MNSTEKIFLTNGEPLLSAKEVALMLDCAPDYVGKLCREGKLVATRTDSGWLIEKNSVVEFDHARIAAKIERAKELSLERKFESARHNKQTKVFSADRSTKSTAEFLASHRAFAFAVSGLLGVLVFAGSFMLSHASIWDEGTSRSSLAAALGQIDSPFFGARPAQIVIPDFGSGSSTNTFFSNLFTSIFNSTSAPTTNTFTTQPQTTVQVTPTQIRPSGTSTTIVQNSTYPVIERTVERIITQGGISQKIFDTAFSELTNALTAKIYQLSSQQNNSFTTNYAPAQRIDNLQNVTITNGRVDGLSGLTDADIPNDITASNYLPLSGGALSALTIGTLNGPLQANEGVISATSSIGAIYGGTGITSYNTGDILYASAPNTLSTLGIGANGRVLKVSGGVPVWGVDNSGGGGGGGSGAWATTTDSLAMYPSDISQVVLVGNDATTTLGNIFEVSGNALFRDGVTTYGTSVARSFTATSTTASIFPYASSTAITVSGTASTSNLIASNSFTLPQSFTGFLKATAGVVSAALVDLASNVTGILPVQNGGTGVAAIESNTVLLGNGTGAISTTTRGNLTGTGITVGNGTNAVLGSGTTLTLDTSGNWSGTFDGQEGSYYLANSFSTTSASYFLSQNTGAAFSTTSVDYWKTQNNFFATTSSNYWLTTKTTANLTEGSNLYFTDARVQTYLDSMAKGYFFSTTSTDYWKTQNNFFSTTSASYFLAQNTGAAFSTTSADYWKTQNNFFSTTSSAYWLTTKTTDDLTQGSTNKYYSDTLVNAYIHASTTIPKVYTANTFSAANTFTGAVTFGSLNGPLQANNGVLSATSSIGVLYGGTGLTAAPSYGQVLLGNASGGYDLVATSSLGITGGGGGGGITAIGPAGQTQTGATITFATSTTGSDFTITATGNTVTYNLPTASSANTGKLSATDWNIFNNKISSTSLSGASVIAYNSSTGVITTQGGTFGAGNYVFPGNITATGGQASFANASTTNLSANTAAFGGTGTTTISSTGALNTPSATIGSLSGLLYGNSGAVAAAAVTSPLSFSAGTLSITQSGTGANGYLSSTDWNVFNNKISSTSLSGGTGISYNSSTGVITNTGVTSTSGDWTGTFDGQEGTYYLDARNLTSFGTPFYTFFSATTTDALTQGSTNRYYSNTLVNSYLHSSTTLAKTYTDNTFTGGNIFGNSTTTNATTTSLYISGPIAGAGLAGCSSSVDKLLYNAATGQFSCGTDQTGGGGGGSDVNWTFFNGSGLRPATTTNQVVIGGTATTSLAKLQVIGGTLVDSATTTNLYSTTASSTNLYTSNFSIGSLTGFLKATAGVVSAALVDLASNVTGILPVSNGGTGVAAIESNTVLLGNGTGAIATTTRGNLTGTGITVGNGTNAVLGSGTTLTLDTSGNWGGTFDGQEGSYYLANSFATTSADYWKTQNNFFSTTSSNYWFTTKTTDDLTQGSTNKYYSDTLVNTYIHASTTIPKTYTANIFSALQQFAAGASTTQLSAGLAYFGTTATSSFASNGVLTLAQALTVANGGTGSTTLTGILKGNGTGVVQTAIPGTDYLTTAITAIGPTGQTQTGATITFATSTTGTDFTITATGNTITYNLPTATGVNTGKLSATDWNIFNNKISSSSLSGASVIAYNPSTGVITTQGGTFGAGNYVFPGNLTATGGQASFANASTTNLSANTAAFGGTGTTTISSTGALNTPSATIGSLSGLLYGNSGAVAAAAVSSPLSFSAGTLSITQSGAASNGYLSSTDWNIFNNKISSTSLSGSSVISYNSGTGIITTTGGTFGAGNYVFPASVTAPYASSTALTVSGTTYLNNLLATASSTIGGGTQASGLTISGGATTTGTLIVQGAGTSTFAHGIDIASGCFALNGNCLSTGITAIGPTGQTQTGATITFATSTTGTDFTITATGNTITYNLPTATGVNTGKLSATDWNIFNNKISSSSLSGASVIAYNPSTGVITTQGGTFGAGNYVFPGNISAAAASTSLLSVFNNAYFGGTATSTFDSAGNLSVAGTLGVTGNTLLANASTTNLYASAALSVAGSVKFSSFGNGCYLLTDGTGTVTCGSVTSSGGDTNWSFFNGSGLRLATTSNQVLIGASATTSLAKLEVQNGNVYFQNSLGIGTTSPYLPLSVGGSGVIGGTLTSSALIATTTLSVGTTSTQSTVNIAGGNITHTASGNPTLAATVATSDFVYSTYVVGNYAYVAENANGLRILDITNPKSPVTVGSYTGISSAFSVVVAGKYAYVGDSSTGLNIIDISNPKNPTLIGTYGASGRSYTLAISGKYIYAPDILTGVVNIIDISNPATPVLAGTYTTNGATGNPYAVAVSGKYLYIGDQGTQRIYIVDVSNPKTPTLMSSYSTNVVTPTGIAVSGQYAYITDNSKGFYALDISNPASIAAVATYSNTSNYGGLSVAGSYAYISDRTNGALVVLDVSASTTPRLVGSYAVGSTPRALFVSGKYAYLSGYDLGLKVIDINGTETPAANIGSLAAGSVNIADSLNLGGDLFASGGLSVGISGIYSRGTIAAYVASSTQPNPVVASFMGGNVGIGTTSPFTTLSVNGSGFFGGNLIATNITATGTLAVSGNTTLTNATSTNLFGGRLTSNTAAFGGTGTTTISSTGALYTPALTVGSLTGLLKASSGVVSAAVAGTDYLVNAITGIGPTGQTQTGPTITYATTTTGTDFTITASGNTINFNLPTASNSNRGLLSSADWTTFNSKAGLSANIFTGLQQFSAGASTTQLSVFNGAYFGATATSTFTSTGALGIASSTPWGLLSINPNGISGPSFVIGSSTLTSFIVSNGGNVGIGTTSPYSIFSVSQTASVAQFTLAYDTADRTDFRTDATGNLWVVPTGSSGGNVYMTNNNLWVCTGGSITSNACPTGTPTGQGNIIAQNKVGIGTSTPNSLLTVAGTRPSIDLSDTTAGTNLKHWLFTSAGGNLYVGTSTDAYATSTIAALTINSNGFVGIGTTTPTQGLSVAQKLFVGNGAPTTAGTATSTFQGDVLITGKLDVSTIDPVYTIDGTKYATYALAGVGIKEEMSTTVTLTTKNKKTGKYEYVIDFANAPKGSDAWLFYQITTFGEGWKDLVANVTPGFDGAAFYTKDPATNTLRISSDMPGEVSVRLVATRFDTASWPNLRPDQDGGFGGFQLQSK